MKREAEQLGTTVDALTRELRAERAAPVDVVLMAHGSQERLAGVAAGPKQLFDVAGETILQRTLRLLAELALCKVGICAPAELAEHAMTAFQSVAWRNAENVGARTLVGNMHGAAFKPRADHAQLFLLCDVVWDPADLAVVLRDQHPAPIFYGRHRNPYTKKEYGELFAIRATPRVLEPFADCPSLWELHARIAAPIREMHGYTDDVDTPEDFADRLPLLRAFVSNERIAP